MFIYVFIKVFLSWHDPSCFDLAKSQTGTQKIAASATAAQRMAQRFPSRLDNADEFQVIVQRGASRDLLDLALFICIESHLGKVGVGGGLWPLIGEMMEWMVANHQDVYTDIWWSFNDQLMDPWWYLIEIYKTPHDGSSRSFDDTRSWLNKKIGDTPCAYQPLPPHATVRPCAYSKHPNHPNHPHSIQIYPCHSWRLFDSANPNPCLIQFWSLFGCRPGPFTIFMSIFMSHGWFQQNSLDSQLKSPYNS